MRVKKAAMVPLLALILSASVLVSLGAGHPASTFSAYETEKKQLELENLSREQPRVWTDYPVFAHALGSVQGRANTNSKDAFLESYEAGQRVFEVDLQLTSDGALVARHDWEQISYYNLEQTYAGVMDHAAFLASPICFYYTPLDIQGLMELLIQYPDAYLVTDSKDTDEQSVRAQLRNLKKAVEETGQPERTGQAIAPLRKPPARSRWCCVPDSYRGSFLFFPHPDQSQGLQKVIQIVDSVIFQLHPALFPPGKAREPPPLLGHFPLRPPGMEVFSERNVNFSERGWTERGGWIMMYSV